MSESPGSRTVITETLWSLPEAVPKELIKLATFNQERGCLSITESESMPTELNVVSFEVENLGSAEDGHVLNLGLSDGRAVV